VYRLMADGELRPRLTEISFDEVPEGLRRLRAGEVSDRLVMVRQAIA
jgi:propanol-preferring alcohol dehydrogenase